MYSRLSVGKLHVSHSICCKRIVWTPGVAYAQTRAILAAETFELTVSISSGAYLYKERRHEGLARARQSFGVEFTLALARAYLARAYLALKELKDDKRNYGKNSLDQMGCV